MSERSVRVMSRKLRSLEDAAVDDAQRLLREIASELTVRVPVSHPARISSVMLSGLTEMAVQATRRGVLLLSDMVDVNDVAMTRDLRAVGANSGREGLDVEVLSKLDQTGWLIGASNGMRIGAAAVAKRLQYEADRQIALATRYDDPVREGIDLRLVSDVRIRRIGRPGLGVAWGAISAFSGLYVNVGWGMVNKIRSNAWSIADDVYVSDR